MLENPFPLSLCVEVNPFTSIDLLPLPSESRVSYDAELRAKEIKKLYEQVRNQLRRPMQLTRHGQTSIETN